MTVKLIAYYLPQFHPIPENDEWWGKGFTEWTNVTKAKPLFRGHQQPFLPSDLGFYDLRVPEVREEQVLLAKEAGLYGFCYWHYWFGNGKQILERPLNEVVQSKKPDFPFCIAWANETWSGRWHGLNNKILIKQEYPGIQDYEDHFYACLPLFRDDRYIRINNKLLFQVLKPFDLPDPKAFIDLWRELAYKNGLNDFHFVAITDQNGNSVLDLGFDSFVNIRLVTGKKPYNNIFEKAFYKFFKCRIQDYTRNFPHKGPEIGDYTDFVNNSLNQPLHLNEFPSVISSWDNTPRSFRRGVVYENCTPELYAIHLAKALNLLKIKDESEQFVFIKSWNEWAEGNTLEPSLIHGKKYIELTKQTFSHFKVS